MPVTRSNPLSRRADARAQMRTLPSRADFQAVAKPPSGRPRSGGMNGWEEVGLDAAPGHDGRVRRRPNDRPGRTAGRLHRPLRRHGRCGDHATDQGHAGRLVRHAGHVWSPCAHAGHRHVTGKHPLGVKRRRLCNRTPKEGDDSEGSQKVSQDECDHVKPVPELSRAFNGPVWGWVALYRSSSRSVLSRRPRPVPTRGVASGRRRAATFRSRRRSASP